jgi:hypothetical protein
VNAGISAVSDPDSPGEDKYRRISQRVEQTISSITERKFSFFVDNHQKISLGVFWGGQKMTLEQLPDGLRSIIGWLVLCVAKLEGLFPNENNPLDLPAIILLDEPEGHLHPAWQRKILPAAQKLLPNAQFFVATHSPFVISSVSQGWIHVFKANAEGVVTLEKPRKCELGDTWLDAVEDALGLRGAQWYDPETEKMLLDFRTVLDLAKTTFSEQDIENMRLQANVIANRSDSLRDMMARELNQFDRQLKTREPQPT